MRDLLFSFFWHSRPTCRHVFSWYIKVELNSSSSAEDLLFVVHVKYLPVRVHNNMSQFCDGSGGTQEEWRGDVFIISAENADRCHRSDRASASCLRDSLLIDWLTVSFTFTLCFLFLFLRRLLFAFWWTSQVISLRISSGSAASDSTRRERKKLSVLSTNERGSKS